MDWRPIKEFERYYEINRNGQIRNRKRNKLIKQHPDKDGYFRVILWHSEKGWRFNRIVHRLLCEAFIPNPDNKKCVNHKDGNKQNNNLSNLEWVTDLENKEHAMVNNLMRGRPGESHHNVKLTEKDILRIRQLIKEGQNDKEIGKLFKVHKGTINKIRNGYRWKHI